MTSDGWVLIGVTVIGWAAGAGTISAQVRSMQNAHKEDKDNWQNQREEDQRDTKEWRASVHSQIEEVRRDLQLVVLGVPEAKAKSDLLATEQEYQRRRVHKLIRIVNRGGVRLDALDRELERIRFERKVAP